MQDFWYPPWHALIILGPLAMGRKTLNPAYDERVPNLSRFTTFSFALAGASCRPGKVLLYNPYITL